METAVVVVLMLFAAAAVGVGILTALPAPYRIVSRRNPRRYKPAYTARDAADKANEWHRQHPGESVDVMTRREHEAMLDELPKPDVWYQA